MAGPTAPGGREFPGAQYSNRGWKFYPSVSKILSFDSKILRNSYSFWFCFNQLLTINTLTWFKITKVQRSTKCKSPYYLSRDILSTYKCVCMCAYIYIYIYEHIHTHFLFL